MTANIRRSVSEYAGDLRDQARWRRSIMIVGAMLAITSLISVACKTNKKHHGQDLLNPSAVAKSYDVQAAVGNGLDMKIDRALVWQRHELPQCLQNRVGVKYFVWNEQKTVSCHTSGAWE